MGEFAIGQPVSRLEDPRLLKGLGRYIDDLNLPGQAHASILRSPHAHARIRSIDTRKAAAMPGVLGVLTGADCEADGLGHLPCDQKRFGRDGGDMYRPPRPILVRDRARVVGDYVAMVLAETGALARDAAETIFVDYEPLPAVVSPADAAEEGLRNSGRTARATSASSMRTATRRRSRPRSMPPTSSWSGGLRSAG